MKIKETRLPYEEDLGKFRSRLEDEIIARGNFSQDDANLIIELALIVKFFEQRSKLPPFPQPILIGVFLEMANDDKSSASGRVSDANDHLAHWIESYSPKHTQDGYIKIKQAFDYVMSALDEGVCLDKLDFEDLNPELISRAGFIYEEDKGWLLGRTDHAHTWFPGSGLSRERFGRLYEVMYHHRCMRQLLHFIGTALWFTGLDNRDYGFDFRSFPRADIEKAANEYPLPETVYGIDPHMLSVIITLYRFLEENVPTGHKAISVLHNQNVRKMLELPDDIEIVAEINSTHFNVVRDIIAGYW